MSEFDDALKAGRDFVWKSFDLHFKQRNEFLRTYAVIVAAIYAAIGFVFKEKQCLFGLFVALFAIVLSAVFWIIDWGAKQYMWDYRGFLEADEKWISSKLSDAPELAEQVRLFEKSGKRPGGYGSAIGAFYLANIVLAGAFAVLCLVWLCAWS